MHTGDVGSLPSLFLRPVPASLHLVSMNYQSFAAGVAATLCLMAFYSADIIQSGNYGPWEINESFLLNTNTGEVRLLNPQAETVLFGKQLVAGTDTIVTEKHSLSTIELTRALRSGFVLNHPD
jgi:hypothetical protein